MSSVAVFITSFGSLGVLAVPAGFILLWLYLRGFLRAAIVFALTFGGAGALTFLIKWCLFVPGVIEWDHDAAIISQYFPSGHVVLSCATFGAVGVISQYVGRVSAWLAYGLPLAIVLLIGWSRVAIEAHPWGDVAGGYAIGAAAIACFARFCDLRRAPPRNIYDLTLGFIFFLSLCAIHPLPLQINFGQ